MGHVLEGIDKLRFKERYVRLTHRHSIEILNMQHFVKLGGGLDAPNEILRVSTLSLS